MKKPVKAIKGVNKRYDLPSGKKEYSDPGLDAMSKVIVERNKNLNFIDRANNQNKYPSVQTKSLRGFENEDPAQRSTHLMANGYDEKTKKFTAYPTIEYDSNSKRLLDKGPDADGNWSTPSEEIQTTSGSLASYFSEKGMKDNTGLARSEDSPLPESSIVAKKKNIVQLRKGINMSTTPADSFATKRKYDMGTPSVGGIIPKKNVTVPSGGFDPMSDKAGMDKLAGGDLSKPTVPVSKESTKGTGIVSKVAGLAPSASGTIKGIGNLFTTYGTIRGGNSATSEDAIKTGALMGNIGNTVGNIETTSNKAGDTAAEVLPLLMKKGINFKGKTKKMC